MARRPPEETPRPETVEEARELYGELRERRERLGVVPGVVDGSLQELQDSLNYLLREYTKLTRRKLGALERDLEEIATRTADLVKAGRLRSKHARLVSRALQHTKRGHFWNVRKIVEKLDRLLVPMRVWRRDLESYRDFYRRAQQRVRDAEEELARLREVPRPPASPEEVRELEALLQACDRATDEVWVATTHRPAAEASRELIAHPDIEGLGLLSTMEFACLRELSDLFEAKETLREAMGHLALSELVGTADYSAAKWERVYPDAMPDRFRLQELFHQLRPVVEGYHGSTFGDALSEEAYRRRVSAWRKFPGAEDHPAWAALLRVLESGRVPKVQEAGSVYARFGDVAERAWRGDIEGDIAAKDEEIERARAALSRLKDPGALEP